MVRRALVENDAKTAVKQLTERAINRIDANLREARRVYVRRITSWPANTGPNLVDDYSAYVDLAGSPPSLTGTQLHTRVSTAYVGNALFFAKQLPPLQVVTGITTTVGVTTTTVGVLVFYYYYVALAPGGRSFGTATERHLYEWKSVPYLEYGQLTRIGDADLRAEVIKKLQSQGGWMAYDISQKLMNNAFYTLKPNGTLTAKPDQLIQRASLTPLTTGVRGRTVSGYSVSLSPNSADLPLGSDKFLVPLVTGVTSWSGESPSGFEITKTGKDRTRGATLLRIRLVLLAQGPFKGFIAREGAVASMVQDVW